MTSATPVQQKERLFVLDALRGIAVCGILIMNMPGFSRPYQWHFNLNVNNEWGTANLISWYVEQYIFDGSFRGLFSILFGAGVILLTNRLEKSGLGLRTADIYYRRLIWLLIFGLINAYVLLWVGDILYHYALCGLFLFAFRKSSPKFLLILVGCFVAILMFKSWLGWGEAIEKREKGLAAMAIEAKKDSLTEDQKKDLSRWKEDVEESKVESQRKGAEKEIKKYQQSYTKVWAGLKSFIRDIESSIFYDDIFFDVMMFTLLGMFLFKTGVLTGEKPIGFYAGMMLIGYGLVFSWGIYQGNLWRQAEFDFYKYLDIAPLRISLYHLRRMCCSLGHIGLIMVLWKSGFFNWLLRPFANLGQMAFTNYLMQSIICTLIFYGYGLGYFGKFQRAEVWYFTVSIWVFQMIFSAIWLHFFRFGPLEWLWRSLTYWKRQPIVKEKHESASVV